MPLPATHPLWILDHVPTGCCILRGEGEVILWNQVLETWTGRDASRILGQNLFDLFPALAQPRFRERILDVLRLGTPSLFSPALNPHFFPCTRSDGHPRIQQTTLNRLNPDEDGRPRVLITVQDMTDPFERGEKYRSARAVALEESRTRRESEERLRRVLENMPVIAFALDENQRCLFWNLEAERVTGYPASEVLETGGLFHILLPDERYRDSILRTLTATAGNFLDWEVQVTCKHGGIRTLALSSISRQVPIPGWPGGWGIGVDVTDRRQKEAAVRESEARHRAIAELSASGILLGSAGGSIQDCNSAACAIFQYPKEELTRMSIADLVADENAGPMRLLGTPSLTLGNEPLEMRCRRKGGATFPAELSAKTYMAGGQRQFVVFLRDVSDAKRTEEAMRTAQKQESLGVLAGGIAHDFNNLFSAVQGNLDLALDRLPADSGIQTYLQQIRTGIQRASELSRKMLTFSGRGRFALQPVDLQDLLQEMTPLLLAAIPRKVDLRIQAPAPVSPVDADPGQLQQLIVSLVNNAADAIGDQAGSIELILGAEELDAKVLRARFPGQSIPPGPCVTLAVQDSGCGISPDNLPRIFDPFFTTKFAGRGLSLSVTQGILRAHHAGITVQSRPGEGATFTLYFPASRALPVPAPPLQPAVPAQAMPRRILLVDDEALLRDSTTELLQILGYEVLAARDGQEAMEIFQERRAEIGLVLMDLTMPRMDGSETFLAMRKLDPAVRVILTSGYSEPDVLERLEGLGLSGFLPKPYHLKELEAALDGLYGKATAIPFDPAG